MSIVNSELDLSPDASEWQGKRKNNPAFKEAVNRLFGRSDGLIVRAVDDFLAKNPGSFDHQSLRLIAAAAPHFADPNHVAYMIDNLPITQMEVALAPTDLEETSAHFGHIIPNFSPRTSQKLVLDLVRTSASDVLQNSPPDRIPEAGRNFIVGHLSGQMKRDLSAMEKALQSPFVDQKIVATALDRIERVLSNTDNLAFDEKKAAFACLARIVDDDISTLVDDVNLDRAWRGLSDLALDVAMPSWQLAAAVHSDRVIARHARSLVYALDRSGRRGPIFRAQLLESNALPDDVARTIASGADPAQAKQNPRLACWRIQRIDAAADLGVPSPRELDLALASGPLTDAHIWSGAVEDPEALDMLASRSGQMDALGRTALLRNPNFSPSHAATMLDEVLKGGGLVGAWKGSETTTLRPDLGNLLTSPKLDDQQIARLANELIDATRVVHERCLVLAMAACNASSGPVVVDQLDANLSRTGGHGMSLMRGIAMYTASTYVQEAIARRVSMLDDREAVPLAERLLGNGMLKQDTHDLLRESGAEQTEVTIESSSLRYASASLEHVPPLYSPIDIADLVASGQAPSDRADHVLLGAQHHAPFRRQMPELAPRMIASGDVSDKTLMTLAGDDDPHFALLFATHPGATARVGAYVSPGPKMLEETGTVLAETPELLVQGKKEIASWSELPVKADRVIPQTPVHALLQGREVGDGLTLRIATSSREISQLAGEMGNCISNYAESIIDGRKILGYARDRNDIYAAMWMVLPPGEGSDTPLIWLEEINSRFNKNNVPDRFTRAVRDLSLAIDRGELRPEVPETSDDHSSTEAESEQPVRLVRPPRRAAVPELTPVSRRDDAGEGPAPSVLGRSAEAEPSTESTTDLTSERSVIEPDADPATPQSDDIGYTFG